MHPCAQRLQAGANLTQNVVQLRNMMSIDIFVHPDGDWYSVEYNGESIISGHRVSIYDLKVLIETLTNEQVEVIEDEHVGE